MNYYLGPYQWIDNSWQPPATTIGAIDLRNLTHMGTPVVQDGVGFFATTNIVSGYDLLGQGDLREINSTGAMKSLWNSILGYGPNGDKLVDLLYDQLTAGADPTGAIACKPLMPARGNLTIHLGGHSVIKSTQFRFGHSPESNKVISVLQEDYRKIRNLTGNDLPTDHHRKVLDFWGEQYRIKNPHLLFIPNDLPVELPIPHDTSISENFDGADNAAIGKQLTWVEDSSGNFWDNFNNRGRRISVPGNHDENSVRVTSALDGTDQRCDVTIVVATEVTEADGGPACRRSSSAVTFYSLSLFPKNVTIHLNKFVTGTRTVLTNITQTASIPDTIKLEVIGSDLEGFFNGVSKTTKTDTSITGNLFCGMWANKNTSDNMSFDDWSAEDIIIPGGSGAGPSVLVGLL